MINLKTFLSISILICSLLFVLMSWYFKAEYSNHSLLTMDDVVDSISRQGVKLTKSNKDFYHFEKTKVKEGQSFQIDGKDLENLGIFVFQSERECNEALNEFREYYSRWQMRRTIVLPSKNVLILCQPYEYYISGKNYEFMENIEKAMNGKFKSP